MTGRGRWVVERVASASLSHPLRINLLDEVTKEPDRDNGSLREDEFTRSFGSIQEEISAGQRRIIENLGMAADVESVSLRPRAGLFARDHHKARHTETTLATWHACFRRLWSRPVKSLLRSDAQ